MSDTKIDNKEPQNKDLQVVVETIAKKINNSPALNGGFDRMMVIVEHIQEKQEEANNKMDRIHDSLYDPDDGLYARVKSVEVVTSDFAKRQDEHLSSDEKVLSQLTNSLKKLNEDLMDKLVTTKKLKKIAGDELERLELMIRSKNVWLSIWSKAAWLLGGGILAAVGKTVWDLIVRR